MIVSDPDWRLFYPIAVSFVLCQGSMMNEAIDCGRGKGIVLIQDFSSMADGSIGCDDDGAQFIAVGYDLKEASCFIRPPNFQA